MRMLLDIYNWLFSLYAYFEINIQKKYIEIYLAQSYIFCMLQIPVDITVVLSAQGIYNRAYLYITLHIKIKLLLR